MRSRYQKLTREEAQEIWVQEIEALAKLDPEDDAIAYAQQQGRLKMACEIAISLKYRPSIFRR